MKNSPFYCYLLPLFSLVVSATTVCAQQGTVDDLTKQIPTNKQGVKNTVETAKEAVKPALQSKDKKLQEMIQRARLVTKKNAEYIQDVAEGKVLPFAKLHERYVKEFPQTLSSLTSQYNAIFEEANPAKQKQMVQALQKALFPIGAYLQPARYGNAKMALTKQQHTELTRLQKLDPRTQIGKKGLPELRAQSDPLTYTMLHLPVYMKVKAQAHSTVYFRSGGGGEFSNGLTLQEVKADKNGVASTTWVSKGDAVGVAIITATSPQSSSPDFFRINVIGLSLKSLPEMPVLPLPSEEVQKKLEALKKSHTKPLLSK